MEKQTLKDYLTPDFWRFNLAFCVQYMHIDYNKLMTVSAVTEGAHAVHESVDYVETERIIAKHFETLKSLEKLAGDHFKERSKTKRREIEAEFMQKYCLILRRLMFQNNVDYAEAPDTHKTMVCYDNFLDVYVNTMGSISREVEILAEEVDKFDAEIAKAEKAEKRKGRAKKPKKVLSLDLALDKFKREKNNGP